jgi:hypothetical protein
MHGIKPALARKPPALTGRARSGAVLRIRVSATEEYAELKAAIQIMREGQLRMVVGAVLVR